MKRINEEPGVIAHPRKSRLQFPAWGQQIDRLGPAWGTDSKESHELTLLTPLKPPSKEVKYKLIG